MSVTAARHSSPPRSGRRGRFTAALLTLAALAGCTGGDADLTASRTSPQRGEADPGASIATVAWSRCTDRRAALAQLQCATLDVPLDPAEPSGEQIELALARFPSTGSPAERIGSVVFNPGGPGGSGIEFLASAASLVPEELTARFDLVSFDPRGVGESSPVRCIDDATKDEQLEGDLSPDSDEELQQMLDESRDYLDGCQEHAGDLLTHMSTADVAADLDRIRAAVGDKLLTYVGFSYGTAIGAVYATLFPENTRALVLDGSVSPDATPTEKALAQGHGFESTLASFVDHCDAQPSCALGPDAATALAETRASLAADPVGVTTQTGERFLGPDLFDMALATVLYDTTMWGPAAEAIADVRGDGALLLFTMLDRQLGRDADGTYDNSTDARSMVNCADQEERPTEDDGIAEAREIMAELPTFGYMIGWGALACLDWPAAANPLPALTGSGAGPILVIGTVGDPATPYEWSEQMVAALESAQLLTYEGDGHTAFLRGGPCVDDAVVAFLIDLEVPASGTSCPTQADDVSFSGLRDEVVSQLVGGGLPRSLAECITDGIIDEVGQAAFDQLVLGDDIDAFTDLVTNHALACSGRI